MICLQEKFINITGNIKVTGVINKDDPGNLGILKKISYVNCCCSSIRNANFAVNTAHIVLNGST